MSQSAIVHDGIFGLGDEQQNNNAEKLFEDAAAKGFRPCTYAYTLSSRAYPRTRYYILTTNIETQARYARR
jgi:hypothetical protein